MAQKNPEPSFSLDGRRPGQYEQACLVDQGYAAYCQWDPADNDDVGARMLPPQEARLIRILRVEGSSCQIAIGPKTERINRGAVKSLPFGHYLSLVQVNGKLVLTLWAKREVLPRHLLEHFDRVMASKS